MVWVGWADQATVKINQSIKTDPSGVVVARRESLQHLEGVAAPVLVN